MVALGCDLEYELAQQLGSVHELCVQARLHGVVELGVLVEGGQERVLLLARDGDLKGADVERQEAKEAVCGDQLLGPLLLSRGLAVSSRILVSVDGQRVGVPAHVNIHIVGVILRVRDGRHPAQYARRDIGNLPPHVAGVLAMDVDDVGRGEVGISDGVVREGDRSRRRGADHGHDIYRPEDGGRELVLVPCHTAHFADTRRMEKPPRDLRPDAPVQGPLVV